MIGHIDAVRMHNIQSWGEDDNVLEFEFTKINVIIARNETGKSVMIKVFRQMCFPSFFGRAGRKDLIKKNKDFGQLDILTSDGHYITFQIYPTSQKYILRTPEGLTEEWVQNSLPEKIRLILGWYIDEESNIILNIIDHEISMPLVETESSFNAKVLRFVVEHQQLEDSVARQKGWITETKELIEAEERTLNTMNARLEMIPRVNVEEIEDKLIVAKILERAVSGVDKVKRTIEEYEREFPTINAIQPLTKEDSREVELIVTQSKAIGDLTELLEESIQLEEPHFNEIDVREYDLIKDTYLQLHTLGNDIVGLHNLTITKPEEVSVNEDIHVITKERLKLYKLNLNMDELLSSLNRLDFVNTQIINTDKNILAMEEQLEVCPLCAKPFHEHKERKVV